MYKDISWTNIDLIWTSLISMTMVDIKNYMVEEYIKIQHLCVTHVLCLDFDGEFKNWIYYDLIWLSFISMTLVDIEMYMMVEYIKFQHDR